MELLAQIHSYARWLVLAAGIAASAKMALGLLRRSEFSRADRILGAVFTGVLDAQALLGVALLAGRSLQAGELPPVEHVLHAAAMFFALAAAHQTARWRAAASARRYRNNLLAYCLALALLVMGIAVVVQNG